MTPIVIAFTQKWNTSAPLASMLGKELCQPVDVSESDNDTFDEIKEWLTDNIKPDTDVYVVIDKPDFDGGDQPMLWHYLKNTTDFKIKLFIALTI